MTLDRPTPSAYAYASWVLAGLSLVLVLVLHLLPAMLAGMLVYELVHLLAPTVSTRFSHQRARLVAVLVLSSVVVVAITFAVAGAIVFFRSDAGSLSALLTKMAEIVASSQRLLPQWLIEQFPQDPDDIRQSLAEWFRVHAAEMQLVGKEAGRALAYVLIGMIIGALVALHEAMDEEPHGPLAAELAERIRSLGSAFRRVVFAQVRISLINTTFTAVYLAVVLPAFGVHLPFAKTMIGLTFVAGLLPVVGNLISNTVIVIVSLSSSAGVALASLAFLVVVHKLEYFLNARIVGTRIGAHTWELLLAMLVMEAAFGIAGVVAAPIYYAFVKSELKNRGLV
jgi:predicted PurR-regulated permease PerM